MKWISRLPLLFPETLQKYKSCTKNAEYDDALSDLCTAPRHKISLMQFRISISSIFDCSLERAFKTPMLCDVAKIHTGYGVMPRITHVTGDEHWGEPGSTKKVYAARSLTQKGGYVSRDSVLERIENKYWKIEVDDFQSWMLGFYKFTGEWKTTELEPGRVQVDYTYTLHSNAPVFYPLAWLFAHGFWKTYMKQVMENVRKMAYSGESLLYP